MRILHLVGTLNLGGIEHLVTELALEQKKQGNEVAVCCLLDRTGALMDMLENQGVPVLDASGGNPVLDLSSRLAKVLIYRRPDVVHSHVNFSLLGQIAAIHRSRLPIAFVITQHTIFQLHAGTKLRSSILYRLVRNKISKHVAVSSFSARHAEELYGLRASSIEIVPNGIRKELFRYDEQARIRYRREWGLSESCFVWGSVGHLTWKKGYDVLARAFAQAFRNCPNTYLVVAGDGTDADSLRSLCQSYGLGSSVRFLGVREDIPSLLSALDAYVQPSRIESAGISILEALANGLVVIASETGGIPDIGEKAPEFLLFSPPGDERALAEVLLDNSRFQPPARRSMAKCPDDFSFNSMCSSYLRIYRDVLT